MTVFRRLTAMCLILFVIMVSTVGCSMGSKGEGEKTLSNSPLTVQVLDIGQGDAILITTLDQITLIDTGDINTREKLINSLKRADITTINNLIITHPHADHIGGAAAIFDNFTVKQVYDSGQTTTSKLYKEYLKRIKEKKIPLKIVLSDEQIKLGEGISMQVLSPTKPLITGSNSDINNNSIVMKLVYANFSMVFSGDAEKEAEEHMVKQYGNTLKSTVLKSGHHGSNTSSSQIYLKAIQPEKVIISVGANNDYHHPHPSILNRYKAFNEQVYRTDLDGTVTITVDGKGYNVTKERL